MSICIVYARIISPHICVNLNSSLNYEHPCQLLFSSLYVVAFEDLPQRRRSKAEREGGNQDSPTQFTFQYYQCLGRSHLFFLLNYAFDPVSSGKSLPVAHLWLLCEGLNYLQTALKSLDERHCISAEYCYSDIEFNDPLQFIRKMHFAVMVGNVST